LINALDSTLTVKNLKHNNEISNFNYKKYFLVNNNQNVIVKTQAGDWIDFNILTNKKKIINISNTSGAIKNVLWNEDLNKLVFINEDEVNLYIYTSKIEKNQTLIPITTIPLKDEVLKTSIELSFYRFNFLYPNQLVIHLRNDLVDETTEQPEIWLGHKNGKGAKDDNKKDFAGVLLIDLETKKPSFWSINNENQKYILGKYPNYLYLATYTDDLTTYEPKVRFEFFNLQNKLNKQMQLNDLDPSMISDFRQFQMVFYFKNKHWHAFDLKNGKHSNITEHINATFYDTRNEFHLMVDDGIFQPFPIYKNRWIVFNELKDICFFDTQTYRMQRKTNGFEEDKVYRLAHTSYKTTPSDVSMNSQRTIKNEMGILLHWTSIFFEKEGLSLLVDDKIEALTEDSARYTQMVRNGNYITYFKEKANQPPALYFYDLKEKKEHLLYESNQWDKDIKKQKSIYVKWKNNKGQQRGAVVRFPIGYKQNVEYPALFNIYEQKMQLQNNYTSDRRSGNGFNYRDYTQAGYFVVEPDIYYEIQDPGFSALNCVMESFDYLIANFNIDGDHVGLIGHSFGSYQTNFILTQTNKFKAAVSSGGVADLTSRYRDININTQKPDMWRMESQQARMGKSIAEIPDKYIQNSATTHAAKMQTPLLIWTGKEDYQVHWHNSIGWYLLLKRLGKNVNLLMYPNTGHVIMDKKTIDDAATRAKQWFDFYLKDEVKPNWLQ
jgi:dienelactone hydrolase